MRKQLSINTGRGYRLCIKRSSTRRQASDVIILCHGLSIDSTSPLMMQLRAMLIRSGAEVIQFDFAGHGKSGGRIKDRRVQTFISDLAQVRSWVADELRPTRIFVVGYSIGALTALLYAAQHPKAFNGLCLLGINSDAAEKLRELRARGMIKDMGNYSKIGSMSVAKDFWKDRAHYNVRKAAMALSVPVVYIAGSADRTNPPKESRDLYTHTKSKKKIAVINGARHNFQGRAVIASLKKVIASWVATHNVGTSQ